MNRHHPRRRGGLHAVGTPRAQDDPTPTHVIDLGPADVFAASRAAVEVAQEFETAHANMTEALRPPPADLLAGAVRAELLADDWRAEFRAAAAEDPIDPMRVQHAYDMGRALELAEAATEQGDEPDDVEQDDSVPVTGEPVPGRCGNCGAETDLLPCPFCSDSVGSGGDGWAEVEAASDADLDAGGPPADELGRVADWSSRHDDRSLEYGVRARLNVRAPLTDKVWPHGPIFDQGMSPPRTLKDASGCTGYSMVAAVNICRPDLRLQGGDAFDLYLGAQKRDSVPGESYAGTSVLAAAQEAKARGWIDAYLWCFGVGDVAQALLQVGPVVLGIPWLSQMKVDGDGVLTPAGERGGLGHAIACIGLLKEYRGRPGVWFVLQQSYGPVVGVGGLLYLHADQLRLLLRGVGEACVPIIATKETP